MIASDILTRVRTQLIDTGVTPRWSDAELLRWLSDAQRTAVMINPTLNATRVALALVAGTRQTLPADAHMLLSVVRNTTATAAPGRAVRVASREIMDAYNPDWHTAAKSGIVTNYIYDPMIPDEFYVSPPNTGLGYVEAIYAPVPADLTTTADPLTVQPSIQQALADYVLYRCHQKDDDYATGGVATTYLQLFMAQISGGAQSEDAASPNKSLGPDVAQRGGVA